MCSALRTAFNGVRSSSFRSCVFALPGDRPGAWLTTELLLGPSGGGLRAQDPIRAVPFAKFAPNRRHV